MKKRMLGGIEVSAVGMGCMGFSTAYGKTPSEDESCRLMRLAHEQGCTLFDTAEIYATYRNEELVGKALEPIRAEVVLESKFSPATLPGQEAVEGGKWSHAGVRFALEASLKRLRTDWLDVYVVHRVPEGSDVEAMAGWMGELIDEGLIRAWGVSQASVTQIRAAHAVRPLSVVQSEYSMMARQWEDDVIPLCAELGIGFEAYSPIASGLLSGKIAADAKFEGDDIRRTITRFSPENLAANQAIVELVRTFAERKGCTPAQIALAWDMHAYESLVPIPGMRSDARIAENLGASEVELSGSEYADLTDALDQLEVHGDRKDEDIARLGALRMELFGGTGVH